MTGRGLAARVQGLLAAGLLAQSAGAQPPAAPADRVKKYRVFFAMCQTPPGRRLLVLRRFKKAGTDFVLGVDLETLATQVLPEGGLKLHGLSWPRVEEATRSDPYGKTLRACKKSSMLLQDAGVVHALPPGNGVVLTIDLCPSPHPLDRSLFASVLSSFGPEEKPVPLGIAITGVWMLEHPKDLAWLRQLEQDGDIAVTWINHSFNHRYSKDLPLSRNFLLEAGTDPDVEVLGTEAAMIDNGLRPSVFFRFPGLVSDPSLMLRVIDYGLIPVGSDAWLAKNQAPSAGSIILVHGNGNEPIGIEKFLALVRAEKTAIGERNWLLFDLRESVAREASAPP